MSTLGPHVGSVVVCATCGVEHVEPVGTCAICADERQWVPADGQIWTSLREMREAGHRVQFEELEPGLLGLKVAPIVGIGQQAHLITTRTAACSGTCRRSSTARLWTGYTSTGRCSRSSPATHTCSACRAPGATRSSRRRSSSASRCWTGFSGPTRRSRAGAAGTRSHQAWSCTSSAATSSVPRSCIGPTEPEAAACCSAPTRSTATPTVGPSPSCAATRTGSRCRRAVVERLAAGVSGLAVRADVRQLRPRTQERRRRRGSALGGALRRLGARRLRRSDLNASPRGWSRWTTPGTVTRS